MPSRVPDLVWGRPEPAPGAPRRGAVATVGLSVLPVVLAALVLLPDLVGLDRHLPFAVSAALRPLLPVLAAAGLVPPLAVPRCRPRRRRAGAVGLAGVAVVVALATAFVVPRAIAEEPPPPGGTPLTVLSFNAFEGQADVDALAEVIRRERPDLAVLPEAGERFRTRIAALVPGYRSWTNVPARAADVRGIVVL